jgi:hypothetical protein
MVFRFAYRALGRGAEARYGAHRALFCGALESSFVVALRAATNGGRPTACFSGTAHFARSHSFGALVGRLSRVVFRKLRRARARVLRETKVTSPRAYLSIVGHAATAGECVRSSETDGPSSRTASSASLPNTPLTYCGWSAAAVRA